MNHLKQTALRAFQFVDEGRALSETAIARLSDSDLAASIELQHELERALCTLETGIKTLRSVLMILAANHEASTLPSERTK